MRYLKPTGLGLLALLAILAALTAANASGLALPELLGELGNAHEAFTGANDASVLELEDLTKHKLNCKAATGTGFEESDTLGTFHITFKECQSPEVGECTGANDAKGNILSEGSFHYVLDTLGSAEESVAVLFLLHEVSYECTIFAKNKVHGTLLCLILKPLVFSKTHLFHCNKGKNVGEQEDVHYYNDKGELIKTQLLAELNGGKPIDSNELALGSVVAGEPVAFMTTD